MFQKVMDQLRKLKADAKTEIDRLEAELATLRAERDLTARLPVPKAEFLARVDSLVEPHEKFAAQLAGLLKPLQAPGRVAHKINPLGITERTEVQGSIVPHHLAPEAGTVTLHALQGLIGPMIREALHAQAEAMAYPSEVGLPAAQRAERLDQLDREATDLQGRIDGLREELNAAGVRL